MEHTLIDLKSDLWKSYPGAYGSVQDLITLLVNDHTDMPAQKKVNRLDTEEKDNERIAFDNLIEGLCHQMSFYPATYLAIPYLLRLLEQKEQEQDFAWQVLILSNIGICLATDNTFNNTVNTQSALPKDVRDCYMFSIERIKEKAKQFLFQHLEELKQLNSNTLSFFCTGLLGILGDRKAAWVLDVGGWEQCYPLCKSCDYFDEEINLDLSDDALMEEINEKIKPAASVIGQWDQNTYEDTYLWFSNVLHLLGEEEAEQKLSYYYGTYTCPECGTKGQVMELVQYSFYEPEL